MIAPPLPLDEHSRLERLRVLGLLDREPIDQLDRLTRLITRHFSLPIAMVSLTDVNRQWFLARTGVALCEISREHSFCGHAILRPDIMQVPDARLDPRFADNPLVTDEPRVVFYAGRPLRALDGVVLGTLCLVDHAPRHLDEEACRDLDDFGHLVESTLHDLDWRTRTTSSPSPSIRRRWAWPFLRSKDGGCEPTRGWNGCSDTANRRCSAAPGTP